MKTTTHLPLCLTRLSRLTRLTRFSLSLLLLTSLAAHTYGGDAKVTLDSADGSSAFLVRDSASNELARVSSDGKVGIGTNTPAASALLDLTSSTKGFLPPRLTATQRAAIASPAEGLLVYQTDGTKGLYQYNGTSWAIINSSSPTYTTGLNADLGGYVFYVTPDGKHGLVSETQDQLASVNWYNAPGFVSDPLYHSLAGKNFTDWRMPTIYELGLMYASRVAITGFSATSNYWSSSHWDSSNAHYQYFGTGVGGAGPMTITCAARSIRSF